MDQQHQDRIHQLYNYAVVERLRSSFGTGGSTPSSATAAALAFLGASPAASAYQQQTNGIHHQHPAAVAAALSQLGRSTGPAGMPGAADLSPFFLTYAAAKFQQQQQQQNNGADHMRLFQQQQQQQIHPAAAASAAGLRGPANMVEEPKPQHSYIGLIAMVS